MASWASWFAFAPPTPPPPQPPSPATSAGAKRPRDYDDEAAPPLASALSWDESALMQRQRLLASLPEASQALISEMFRIVSGEDDEIGEDDTVLERDPGFEKPAPQRQEDVRRVREILGCKAEGVHANLRWKWGETLVHLALEYDHRHPPEMLLAVLEAGTDPNAPNAMDGERPLDSPWLDQPLAEDRHVAEKRICLLRFGAKPTKSARGGYRNTA